MPTLNHTIKTLAYSDDSAPGNNPLMRDFDWTRPTSVSVDDPKSYPVAIPAGATALIFDGTRATSLDGTSAFSVTQNPLSPNRYRFTWTGGTNPVLRTDRGLTLTTQQITMALGTDQSLTMTAGAGAGNFSGVQVGDTVFVPGVSTGDAASVFNSLNEGLWVVLAVLSSTVLQLVRPSGTTFQGASETVTLASNAQLQAFSAAGVQPGDSVAISAGFALSTQKTFVVDTATSKWFEVISALPIALETGKTPGASGLIFYTNACRWVRVEADQEVSLRLNGASDDRNLISPIQAAVKSLTGWFEKWGPTWSLTVVNRSSQTVNLKIFSAE